MFTLDTESGFRDVVFITSAYGLGELLVQGAVNPDEFYVHKPMLEKGRPAIVRRSLGSKLQKMVFGDIGQGGQVDPRCSTCRRRSAMRFLFRIARCWSWRAAPCAIERHYGRPMDIEWGKDGTDGRLYVLQARPETVKSRTRDVEERYALKGSSRVLASGRAIGHKIGSGAVRVVPDASEMARVKKGDVLVTDMTDPNWEPVMKLAAAIVTNRGGRTCHAAIIARELGIPAVVGCGDATRRLKDGQPVTVSCAEGDTGNVYEGLLPFEVSTRERGEMPRIPVKIAMNVGNPELAFEFAQLPNAGVGLARLEFIINNEIGVHPRACLEYDELPAELKAKLLREDPRLCRPAHLLPREAGRRRGHHRRRVLAQAGDRAPVGLQVERVQEAARRRALRARRGEPDARLPRRLALHRAGLPRMLRARVRGAAQGARRARAHQRRADGAVRAHGGRSARGHRSLLAKNGLERGKNGLKIVMMCELPSNAILAEEFLELFDGFSIGSNDLTQLTLGLDRDSGLVAESFDERDAAVKAMLAMAIRACRKHGKYVGICGQGPSDHPDLARWLMEQGIDSLSLNPDTVVSTWMALAEAPAAKKSAAA